MRTSESVNQWAGGGLLRPAWSRANMLMLQAVVLAALSPACSSGDDGPADGTNPVISTTATAPPTRAPSPLGQAGSSGAPAPGTAAMMPPPGSGDVLVPGQPPVGGPLPGVEAPPEAPGAETPAAPGEPCTNCWTYMGFDASSTFHNPSESAISPASAGSLAEIWSKDMGGSPTGAVAVVDGVAYVPSMATVKAIDAASGEELWSVGQSVSGSISYDAGKLYMQSGGGVVVQLDAATGAPGWRSGPISSFGGFGTPLVVGNKVLVGASSGEENLVAENARFRGRAVALDKATGMLLWEHYTAEPPANGAAIWSSPAADPELGLAFFTTGNNYTGMAGGQSDSIIALDLESGSLMWAFQATEGDVYTTVNFGPGPDFDFGANPMLFEGANGQKLVGAGQKSGVFWALDRMTGQMVWNHMVARGCGIGGIFNNGAYDGERIYVTSWSCAGPATLQALDATNGQVVWTKQNTAQSWAPITVAGGVGFVAVQNALQAFDTQTGDPLLTVPVAGSIASAPVIMDGRVFFGSGVPPLAGAFGDPIDGTIFHVLGLP